MSEPTFSLAHVSITYEQRGAAVLNSYESLTVTAEDAGGGHYLVLKTEGWSIDSPDELAALLADFQRRVPEILLGEEAQPLPLESLPVRVRTDLPPPTTEQPPF